MTCSKYDPEKIFDHIQVVEFPFSYVGISSEIKVDVGLNMSTSVYMVTSCNGELMTFEKAQTISPAHRAFEVQKLGDSSIKVGFSPTKDCVSWAKAKKYKSNTFISDLRFIQGDKIAPCCSDIRHAEVKRIYLCGQYEHCKLSHTPKIVDFGNLMIGESISKYIEMRNDSTLDTVIDIGFPPVAAIKCSPLPLKLPANSSKKLLITMKPSSEILQKCVKLIAKNVSNMHCGVKDNVILYDIPFQVNCIHNKNNKARSVLCPLAEPIKQIYEQNPAYTYMGEELERFKEKRRIAHSFLQQAKRSAPKPKEINLKNRCLSAKALQVFSCEPERRIISKYNLLSVLISPSVVDFGKIAMNSHAMGEILIKNDSNCEIVIKLLRDTRISYTAINVKSITLKIMPMSEQHVNIYCLGDAGCELNKTFKYTIDKKYYREHSYIYQAENPRLTLMDTNFKLGMVTPDNFVTSTSVRITNEYNVTVNFEWDQLPIDAPFDIMPKCGSIPKHSTRFCNIIYLCKETGNNCTVVDFRSFCEKESNQDYMVAVTPVEVSVTTRKLGIKLLNHAVHFGDLPLNLEVARVAILENNSRESATFQVVEPLLKGFRLKPLFGTIRPKTLAIISVTVKIPCFVDFSYAIVIKINNRENLDLLINGSVLEPKVVIHPKVLQLSRIPMNMLTYVPLNVQNLSYVKTLISILDTNDEDSDTMFDIYVALGAEMHKVSQFYLEGNESKTIFMKICEECRHEFDFYLPIQINDLLGPPNKETASTDMQYFSRPHTKQYEELTPKVNIKNLRKEITNCRVNGVISLACLKFSQESFEVVYSASDNNMIDFTITNVAPRILYIIISVGKLCPDFTLCVFKGEQEQKACADHIGFELEVNGEASCTLKFHPNGEVSGSYTATAPIFLDECMDIPYSNLTFTGKRIIPKMSADSYRVIFPPCVVGMEVEHILTLKLEGQAARGSFFCESREEKHLTVEFSDDTLSMCEDDEIFTTLSVHLTVSCKIPYSKVIMLNFGNENGAFCKVEVVVCYVQCPLTLHVNNVVDYRENTYPFYPTKNDKVYGYMERTVEFLEQWMYFQGYENEFFPTIPESFYALCEEPFLVKNPKGSARSFIHFINRLAGPLAKFSQKVPVCNADAASKHVLEVYSSYEQIIKLLKSRTCHLWIIQPRFLLSFEQFSIYCNNVTSKTTADILLIEELLDDPHRYYRLSKLAWIELVLQCYRAFVLNSCFLECACPETEERDVVKVLLDWYNLHIAEQHLNLRGKNIPIKCITNLTQDISDGVAIISALLYYCPFMKEHFKCFAEVDGSEEPEFGIINNACLIDDALKQIRIIFPLTYSDFLAPNFVQMLFLSIHLFVTLPMFYPRDVIQFEPPLLRTSARLVTVYPESQESLNCSIILLNNEKNSFSTDKAISNETTKKISIKIKYSANFVDSDRAILIVQGTNKTRIFDTYVLFLLEGQTGNLRPLKKCRLTGPLYRPSNVMISVSSPFCITANYNVTITDIEPSVPVNYGCNGKPKFFLRRLKLSQTSIVLNGSQKGFSEEGNMYKLYLQMVCLNVFPETYFIWFRSDIGEFFMKVVTLARNDVPVDTLLGSLRTWPLEPCNCGEECMCYRSVEVTVPHKNPFMVRAMRQGLMGYATPKMVNVFDLHIDTLIGRGIVSLLLEDGGTDMKHVAHILREDTTYKMEARRLSLQKNQVTMSIHSNALLRLLVTLAPDERHMKFSLNMLSSCGMDVRFYRIQVSIESPQRMPSTITEEEESYGDW